MRAPTKSGFTLVELMIVVAIIGILAAIAIPYYQSFVVKARRSELVTALDGIFTAQTAYFSTHSVYATLTPNCASPPETWSRVFTVADLFTMTSAAKYYGFCCTSSLGPPITFTACGAGDIDNDAYLDMGCVTEANNHIDLLRDDIVNLP